MTLTFDILILKVVSESHVTWATSVPILVFLGLSILDLGPMYATDRRQTDVRRASSLNAPGHRGGGILITPLRMSKVSLRTHSKRFVFQW